MAATPLEMAPESPERVSCVPVPTCLYRHFDGDGKLLYVGISLSPTYRLAQHRAASAWFQRIRSITVEWFDTRQAALDAEDAAVKAEEPEFNIRLRLRIDQARGRAEEMAADTAFELIRKVVRYQPTYDMRGASAVVGCGTGAMRLAVEAGDLPHFIVGKKLIVTGWALIAYMEALEAGHLTIRKLPVHNPSGFAGNATPAA